MHSNFVYFNSKAIKDNFSPGLNSQLSLKAKKKKRQKTEVGIDDSTLSPCQPGVKDSNKILVIN